MPTSAEVFEAIRPVEDPEMGISIVDLGLVYDVQVEEGGSAKVVYTLTSPMCPVGPMIEENINSAVTAMDGITSVDLNLVFDPPWNPTEMASDYAKDVLGIW